VVAVLVTLKPDGTLNVETKMLLFIRVSSISYANDSYLNISCLIES